MYSDSPKWELLAMGVSAPATVCTAVSLRSSIGFFSWPRKPRIPTVTDKYHYIKVT